MQLENIGFYTLDNARAAQVSSTSPLWRCELILTNICNFKCPYCRGIEEEHCGNVSWEKAAFIVDAWASHGLRNIRFSGGEPTMWKAYETLPDDSQERRSLVDLVARAKAKGIQRIAISTNGSVSSAFYDKLIEAGANDFSVSLDACCAETGDRMAGNVQGAWQRVVDNIRRLAQQTYVTVGVVITAENVAEFGDVLAFASNLGVADIRILTSAQWNQRFREVALDEALMEKHPILHYRMENFRSGRHVRGLSEGDNHHCPLMLDDMAILDGNHYPCIIYMREQGAPVGKLDFTLTPQAAMNQVRAERQAWIARTDVLKDPICQKNCLDVCIDYNNTVLHLQPNLVPKLAPTAASKTHRVIPLHPR